MEAEEAEKIGEEAVKGGHRAGRWEETPGLRTEK